MVPVGLVRFDFGLSTLIWDERYGERNEESPPFEGIEPLGFDFSSSSLGSDVFSGISSLEEALRLADAAATLPISMGAMDVHLSHERLTLPIRLEAGVLPWLSIGGTIPLSRRRSEVLVGFNDEGANSGVSPTLTDPGAVSDFLGSLRVATESMGIAAQGICDAEGSGSGACSDALGVVADAETFRSALGSAYTSSPGFPLQNTDPATALITKLGTLAQGAGMLGVGGFPTSLPLSTTPLDLEQLQTIITDPSGSIQGVALEDWRSPWELGDVEVFVNARVLGRSLALPPEPGRSFRYEAGLGFLARLGTGTLDSEDNFVDLGSGDGTTDFEGRAWLNLRKGRRLGLWADLRYGVQGTTTVIRRVSAPDQPLAPLASKASVTWTPGNYLKYEVVPRLHLTDEVAITLSLVHAQKASDEYLPAGVLPGGTPVDVSVLAQETERSLTEFGFGLTFSTLQSPSGRRMEARFNFARPIAGKGNTPHGARIDVGFRLFKRFWGGTEAPAEAVSAAVPAAVPSAPAEAAPRAESGVQ